MCTDIIFLVIKKNEIKTEYTENKLNAHNAL